MLIGGALVIALAGLITWTFTLYFSHRIAGPIYQFTKNLELKIEKGPVTTIAIRKEDSLQVLSDKLGRAAGGLTRYYDNQLKVVDELSRNLDAADGINIKEYSKALQKLKNAVGLVMLEITLACLLMVFLYNEVNNIIDKHLYRMHSIESTSWSEIFTLLTVSMSGFVVINMLVLYLAHLVWERYVRQTIFLFSTWLDKILALDFSDQPASMQGHHRLLDLMGRWLKKEQKRNQEISVLVKHLTDYEGKGIEKSDRDTVNQTLDEYRRLLTGYGR